MLPGRTRNTSPGSTKSMEMFDSFPSCTSTASLGRNFNNELIAAEDPREVEIRAGMVWAIERISQQMRELGREILPYELDWFLWRLGQSPSLGEKPYHRTRTIYY